MNKIKIVSGFLIIFGGLFSFKSVAQTSIKIMDFVVAPNIDQTGVSVDSILLDIDFKINTTAGAEKIHFWLGTEKDSSNIFIAEPIFSIDNSIVKIVYSGVSTEVNGYAADFFVTMSKTTYDNFIAATLFVEASGSVMTSRLYFMK